SPLGASAHARHAARAAPEAAVPHHGPDAIPKFSSLYDCAKKALRQTVVASQARFIRMKSASKKRAPSIVNLTVKRRYLTEREVERLMDCARRHGRYGHRDATMMLVAYHHGLRASEGDLQWQQSSYPKAACTFTGSRTAFPAYI